MIVRAGLVGAALVVVLLAVAYLLLRETGLLATLMNPEALHARVLEWGLWGPMAIIGLMTLAVLVSLFRARRSHWRPVLPMVTAGVRSMSCWARNWVRWRHSHSPESWALRPYTVGSASGCRWD